MLAEEGRDDMGSGGMNAWEVVVVQALREAASACRFEHRKRMYLEMAKSIQRGGHHVEEDRGDRANVSEDRK